MRVPRGVRCWLAAVTVILASSACSSSGTHDAAPAFWTVPSGTRTLTHLQVLAAARLLRDSPAPGVFEHGGCPAVDDVLPSDAPSFACFRVVAAPKPSQVALETFLAPFAVRLVPESISCGPDAQGQECELVGAAKDLPVAIALVIPRNVATDSPAEVKFEFLSSLSQKCRQGSQLCVVGAP